MLEHNRPIPLRRFKGRTLVVAGLAAGLMAVSGCVTVQYRRAPAAVTVHQVIAWSEAKVPARTIVLRMKASHTVYRLSAADLANLRAKGVANTVIDYMQQTYLAAVRHNQKLRDWQDWQSGPDGYWYGGPWMGGDWGWDED